MIKLDAEGATRGGLICPGPIEVKLGSDVWERGVATERDFEIEIHLGGGVHRDLERIAEAERAATHFGEGERVARPGWVEHIDGQLAAKMAERGAPVAVFDVELEEEQRAGNVEARSRHHQVDDQFRQSAGIVRVKIETVCLVDSELEAKIEATCCDGHSECFDDRDGRVHYRVRAGCR